MKHKARPPRPRPAADIIARCSALLREGVDANGQAERDTVLSGIAEWLGTTPEGAAFMGSCSDTAAQIITQLQATGEDFAATLENGRLTIEGSAKPELILAATQAVYANLIYFGYQLALTTQEKKETVH